MSDEASPMNVSAAGGEPATPTGQSGGINRYTVGDLVWAKMKGYPLWPAKVVHPNDTTLKRPPGNIKTKPIQCVYFFGSNNYAWIPEDSIQPYAEFKEKNLKSGKGGKGLKDAVAKIDEYISSGGNFALEEEEEDEDEAGLPSIEEELATIHTGGNGTTSSASNIFDEPADTPAAKSSEKSSAKSAALKDEKKDYSRSPFSKSARTTSKTSAATDAAAAPPAKRARNTNAASSGGPVVNNHSTSSFTANNSSSISKSSAGAGARAVINRTSQYMIDHETPNAAGDLELGNNVSAKLKDIKASKLRFGFIGLGLMGQRLLKNLINSGHGVTVWNRTQTKCKDFLKAGAERATTPGDVVAASDVTFCCLSDPQSVKEIVFGNCGVIGEIKNNKGYVEMTTIDPETSKDVHEAIVGRGGRYLECPISGGGGKELAESGELTLIGSGDKSLFDDCHSAIQAVSKNAFYLGAEVGTASKMNLAYQMLVGNLIGALGESMALVDRASLSQKDFLEILTVSPISCPTLIAKARAMIEGGFATEMPLVHMQKDLRLGLALGEQLEHPLPITASTNEVFKHAKHLGYSDHDAAAVYIRSRF